MEAMTVKIGDNVEHVEGLRLNNPYPHFYEKEVDGNIGRLVLREAHKPELQRRPGAIIKIRFLGTSETENIKGYDWYTGPSNGYLLCVERRAPYNDHAKIVKLDDAPEHIQQARYGWEG